jgi:dihydroflavonol-4-reductase
VSALGIPRQGEILTEKNQNDLTYKQWPYGYAKRTAENEVKLAISAGLDCVIVNPTTVFGPRDINAVSGTLIIQIAQNQVPILTKGGMNVVHVKDIAEGHLAAAELGKCGQRYIIGGQNLSNSKLVKIIAAECQVAAPKILMPSWLIKLVALGFEFLDPFVSLPYNANFLRLSTYMFYYDTSKSHQELNLRPPLPITQAISEAVSWYKANDYI